MVNFRNLIWLSLIMVVLCSELHLYGSGVESGEIWVRHHTFEDFSQGIFPDGGRNLYVSADGSIQTIHRWDLNNDGYLDLVFTQDTNYRTESADAFIYWGSEEGFVSLFPKMWEQRPRFSLLENILGSQHRYLRLPAHGGGPAIIADLNRDRYPDLLFVNLIHNYSHRLNAYVYWGGPEEYSARRRTELPTLFAHDVAVADLNDDQYPDIVFANRGDFELEPRLGPLDNRESYIYWGGPLGFSTDRRSSVSTHNARSCAAGDFNGDGWTDLAFLNSPLNEKASVSVHYGNGKSLSSEERIRFFLPQATRIRSLHLNGDDLHDLAATGPGDNSFLFFGQSGGLDPARVQILATVDATDVAAADLNSDGNRDLVFANSRGDSVLYWGTEQGYSTQSRTYLPTLSAQGVAVADLNEDGYPEIVFANNVDDLGHDVASYIYWGDPTGYSRVARSEIQGFGATDVAVADLNGDRRNDILLMNRFSGRSPNRVNVLVFWGNARSHYSSASVTALQDILDAQVSYADLDADGLTDLVSGSTVCWGGGSGLKRENCSTLSADGLLLGSRVADLNRDGWLDLLYSERMEDRNYLNRIYWGSQDGFSQARSDRLDLPGAAVYPTLADLDKDGFLDLINASSQGRSNIIWGVAGGFGDRVTYLKTDAANASQAADLNGDGWLDLVFSGTFSPENRSRQAHTYVYFGTSEGFGETSPLRLNGYTSLEVAIADLDRDGFLDLVTPNYSAGRNRTLPVFVFWGSAYGTFTDSRRTDLPAESPAGVQVLDLNRDGYREIVVHNHVREGKHDFGSYIYWGGPEGFGVSRRTHLPTTATHQSNMMAPGNVYTRRLEEEYISPSVRRPASARWLRLHWEAETPFGTQVRFQIRAAEDRDALSLTPWQGPAGPNSYFEESGSRLPEEVRRSNWIQYRALLSSPDGGNSPRLKEVAIGATRRHDLSASE